MSRKKQNISSTDLKLGLALLDRKQTKVTFDEEKKEIHIVIDISFAYEGGQADK